MKRALDEFVIEGIKTTIPFQAINGQQVYRRKIHHQVYGRFSMED